jgi:sulfate transport system ATP-binding protein
MSFVGPVNQLDDDWIRPHDLELLLESNGATRPARVERVVHLGFEARVELALDEGTELWAQMTQEQCEELQLEPGSRVHVRPRRARTFA